MNYLKGIVCAATVMVVCAVLVSWAIISYGPGSKGPALESVRTMFNDPEAARFKDVVVARHHICGMVNAKNALGGYIGYQRFKTERYYRSEIGEPAVLENDHLFGPMLREKWDSDCKPDPSSYADQLRIAYYHYVERDM